MKKIPKNAIDEWKQTWKDVQYEDVLRAPLESLMSISFFMEQLPIREGAKVIEPGCGSGIMSLFFASKGANTVCLDTSIEALTIARSLFRKFGQNSKASFILADIRFMPFSDRSFDISFNEGVIEHFEGDDRQRVINEMARLTTFSGWVGICVPNAWNLPYRVWKLSQKKNASWTFGLEIPFSPVELEDRMRKAGLEVVVSGGVGILHSLYLLTISNVPFVNRFFKLFRFLSKKIERILNLYYKGQYDPKVGVPSFSFKGSGSAFFGLRIPYFTSFRLNKGSGLIASNFARQIIRLGIVEE